MCPLPMQRATADEQPAGTSPAGHGLVPVPALGAPAWGDALST